ncbi:hypothetical protein [Streptomyces chilikensis]|uniref:hypothetical protein n=1 Tax=Streptomyces chilikensis TaxID=1194079 RepID=UPI001409683E|nr:hypothetical protein [Streptomyces chilikensis]
MSDVEGAPAADFLDRLIARHAPAAAGPRPGVARVRPRLPGPFERVEAVRETAAEADDDTGLLWPSSTPSPAREGEAPRPAAPAPRPHTERERTVVRTERERPEPAPRPEPRPLPEAPLLRPAAPVVPGPRPAPEAGRRPAGGVSPDRGAARNTASTPRPASDRAAVRAVAPPAGRPSAEDTAAAREAVRQAAARRPSRAPEQVVQVQIGRLEVTAGPALSGAGRQRRPAPERPGTALSLEEYLARGRE